MYHPARRTSVEKSKSPTYWGYLKVKELLSLQDGVGDGEVSADELNFIVIHQVYELWFKLVIRDLRDIVKIFDSNRVDEQFIPLTVRRLDRIITIFKLASDHFELMEQISPQDFIAFRGKLGTASGFQSFQVRLVEFLIGLDPDEMVLLGDATPLTHFRNNAKSLEGGEEVLQLIEEALNSPSLLEVIEDWLYRTPINGSSPQDAKDAVKVQGFVNEYIQCFRTEQDNLSELLITMRSGNPEDIKQRFEESKDMIKAYMNAEDVPQEDRQRRQRIRAAILFIESYRSLPLMSWPQVLLDKLIELEEHLVIFRSRHARMVERMIGRRIGTGGSSGVDYLEATTKYRIFKDLWGIRTILLQAEVIPPLDNPSFYDFVSR